MKKSVLIVLAIALTVSVSCTSPFVKSKPAQTQTVNRLCADKVAQSFVNSIQAVPGSFNCFDAALQKKFVDVGVKSDADLMKRAKGNSRLFDIASCGPLVNFDNKVVIAAYQLFVYSDPRVFVLLILVVNKSDSKVTYFEFYPYLPCTSEYSVTIGG